MRRTNTRDMNMYQSLCARQSVGRLGALSVTWRIALLRTIPALHSRKQTAGSSHVAKAAKMLAGLRLPFLADMSRSTSGGGGGTILCSHSFEDEPTPPYAVAYSQVSLQFVILSLQGLQSAETSFHEVLPMSCEACTMTVCGHARRGSPTTGCWQLQTRTATCHA